MRRELPHGWTEVALHEVCDKVSQRGPSIDTQSFAYIDLGAIDNKFKRISAASTVPTEKAPSRAKQVVASGDVLFSTVRVYLENVAMVSPQLDGAIASTAFTVLRPSEAVDPRYLYRFVTSRPFIQSVNSLQRGNSPPSVQDVDVRGQRIPLPPWAEQQRIVARIEELLSEIDEGERALERAQQLVECYRQSVLKAAVTGELTRDWRLAHSGGGTQKPPSTPDVNLPEGWAWTTVSRAGEVRLGRQRAPQHHQGDHMRPYLRVANVYEDRLDLRDVKEMNFTPREFETYALRPGDILLNEGQSPELVGRPAMYRGEIHGCCYQKTLLRFRARPGVIPDYALLVFRHYLHSGRFRRSANITTSIAHLAAERFEPIEFPLPPEPEQAAIVDAASAMLQRLAHLENELNQQRSASRALREATLKAAFSGQLVDQDPTDEPALTLLARFGISANNKTAAPRRRGGRVASSRP